MLDVVRAGQRACHATVASALRERAALMPPRQWQEHYGGRGLPWATAYLRKALADGERAVARPYAEACAAVLVLHGFLGSNTAVAGLCELRLEDVRDMLAAARAFEPTPTGGSARQDSVGGEDQGIGPGQ